MINNKLIVLISCVKKKLNTKTKASDMYISPLFKYNLKYAYSLNPDKIYILSAKHGLLDLEKEIEPYDITLNQMNKEERLNWSENILCDLESVSNLYNDKYVFLCGLNYREHIIKKISNYEIPMLGLSIGKQLQFLKNKVN